MKLSSALAEIVSEFSGFQHIHLKPASSSSESVPRHSLNITVGVQQVDTITRSSSSNSLNDFQCIQRKTSTASYLKTAEIEGNGNEVPPQPKKPIFKKPAFTDEEFLERDIKMGRCRRIRRFVPDDEPWAPGMEAPEDLDKEVGTRLYCHSEMEKDKNRWDRILHARYHGYQLEGSLRDAEPRLARMMEEKEAKEEKMMERKLKAKILEEERKVKMMAAFCRVLKEEGTNEPMEHLTWESVPLEFRHSVQCKNMILESLTVFPKYSDTITRSSSSSSLNDFQCIQRKISTASYLVIE